MRQLWTPASRPGLFVVAMAVVSVITLAASSPIYSTVRGSHVSGNTSLSLASTASAADCSKAAALQAAAPFHFADTTLPHPIAGVLCGAFAGPGSQVMVATFANGTCWPTSGWAVFRFTGGAWQLVPNGYHGRFVVALAAVGSDIRETVPVWRKSDGICNPTGGTRARTWHWDGTRFIAGAWKQVTPGKTPKKDAILLTPFAYGNTCHMTDDGSLRGSWVYCWIGVSPHPRRHVKLNLNGQFSLAATTAIPLGLGGRDLPYGTKVTVGRFRCQILRSGIKCIVIRSGKGFLFNNTRVRRVGP